VKLLKEIKAAGSGWTAKAVEVPAVLVTKDNVDTFLKAHPDATGQK
jgi:ribose transport system substrate-binding protein